MEFFWTVASGVGLRGAFVVDEEKGEEHEIGDRKSDSCYHVDRLCHSYRMRWFLFSQLGCASIGGRVRARVGSTIGAGYDLVRSCRSSGRWTALSLQGAGQYYPYPAEHRWEPLGDRILSRTIDDIVHRPFTADVIHADELEQAGVDEAHTNAIPHVHGS